MSKKKFSAGKSKRSGSKLPLRSIETLSISEAKLFPFNTKLFNYQPHSFQMRSKES